MESNKNIWTEEESYWKDPHNHALVKEKSEAGDYYSIYTLSPKLLFLICEDLDEARALASRMIEHGVRVFDDFKTLYTWHQSTFQTGHTG